jgi:hypothetical protein
MAFQDKAVAWINEDKNGEKYLAVTLKCDMKEGEKIFLRKNKFKQDGEQSPDYRFSVKVEENTPSVSEQVADDIPF